MSRGRQLLELAAVAAIAAAVTVFAPAWLVIVMCVCTLSTVVFLVCRSDAPLWSAPRQGEPVDVTPATALPRQPDDAPTGFLTRDPAGPVAIELAADRPPVEPGRHRRDQAGGDAVSATGILRAITLEVDALPAIRRGRAGRRQP